MNAEYEGNDVASDAHMGAAVLGGVTGVGTLQVARDADGRIINIVGTWRLNDEHAHDVSHLERAYQTKERVPYKGKLDDANYPDGDEVEVDVLITSVHTYRFDEAQHELPAIERTLYSFEPAEPLPYMR